MKKARQPIVTVLGHVDHGKTTLLDALRNTSVQKGEAGGITQSTGASMVTTKGGKKITFIDTPGHAAFSAMRDRGSRIADIAILVLDASDGVKPQTLEALDYIKKAEVPFIVAITKIDLPAASVEARLAELEKQEVYFEGRGGQTPYLEVSAKEKKGLKELIDLIILLSEVNEISGDPDGDLEAYVLETDKDKAGNSVSVVLKNGKLTVGDKIHTEHAEAKIRALLDEKNKNVKQILPGEFAKILGFNDLPEVGSSVKKGEINIQTSESFQSVTQNSTNGIPIFVKAASSGALEALIASIPKDFAVISSGVGDVTESDVLNAKANSASIFVFESKISGSVKKLAELDGVKVKSYKIIYELLQDLQEIVKKGQLEILGEAQIIAEFPFNKQRVAGCKILKGKIAKSSKLILKRGEKELGTIKAISIKKQKEEVESVGQGEECGLLFRPSLDFQKGDVILSVA